METSLFPRLPLPGLCCYGLYNYLIIKWWRSFCSTVCKVLYSFYEGDFLNYSVTPFLRLSFLTLSLCLSDFRRCLSNDPEQPSVSPRWWIKSVPLAFKALVEDSKAGGLKIKKSFLWESERGRVAPWSALVKLNWDSFFLFLSWCQKWWTVLTKCYRQWHLKATNNCGKKCTVKALMAQKNNYDY